MPNLDLVLVPLYQPLDPYNHQIDNIPIQGLIDRVLLVNAQVDVDATILTDAQGTTGSLANRIAKSLNPDGSLKTAAVDDTEHNIAHHTDGVVVVNDVAISYVRMLNDERAKLSVISSGANKLLIRVNLNSAVPSTLPSQISVIGISEVEFIDGELALKESDSIYWSIDTTGAIKANTNFPATVRHQHHYDIIPVHGNLLTPDYKNYVVTSTGTAYRADSLRVYINGIRLTKSSNIVAGGAPRGNYVPVSFGTDPTWLTYAYSEDTDTDGIVTTGKFSLSSAITSSDVITVDFDTLYVG
jgi:hypothetical protein